MTDIEKYTNSVNIYCLRSWINPENLNMKSICLNPCEGVFNIVEKNMNWLISYINSSLQNRKLFIKNGKPYCTIKPQFIQFSNNVITDERYEWTRKLIEKDPSRINWNWLSGVPCGWAEQLFEKNMDKINWVYLSENRGLWAYKLLSQNPTKISWPSLCSNNAEWVEKILYKNQKEIQWCWISSNTAEWAGKMLEEHPEHIYWDILSKNRSTWAIQMLEKNPEKINWLNLSTNPYIFTYDYIFIRKRLLNTFGVELIEKQLHPSNLQKMNTWGLFDFEGWFTPSVH